VPNADIMLPPRLHGEPLRPGEGRVRRRKRRTAHLVHARLSSSAPLLVVVGMVLARECLLVLNWKDKEQELGGGAGFVSVGSLGA
jgi:hypothetical protein